jgi:hypothetical protein
VQQELEHMPMPDGLPHADFDTERDSVWERLVLFYKPAKERVRELRWHVVALGKGEPGEIH